MTAEPRRYTNRDLAACAEREAKMRETVWRQALARGDREKLREVYMMREIAAHFRALAEAEKGQERLL